MTPQELAFNWSNKEIIEKYWKWIEKQNKKAVKIQKKSGSFKNDVFAAACWEEGYPYNGAIGGDLTYCFSPNSIGMVVYVIHGHTKEEFDLTDYAVW